MEIVDSKQAGSDTESRQYTAASRNRGNMTPHSWLHIMQSYVQ